MKPKRSNPLFARFFQGNTLATAIIVSLVGFAVQPSATAGTVSTLFWDTNGDTAGSGNAGGSWDTNTNWTTDATGVTPTIGWTDGDAAVFSAGTDGIGAWAVTVAGTVATPSILFKDAGAKTISGGIITIGGGTLNTAAAGNGNVLTISSALAGSGGLTVTANGDTSDTGGGVGGATLLSGANTITGDITINGGILRANSNFGNAANKVILSDGGIVDTSNVNFANGIEIPATKNGIYRTYGSVNGAQISGAITGAGTLRHTDGGTLRLAGDGSAFTGIINNVRANMFISTNNWSGTHVVNQDGSKITFDAGATTTIKSYEGDRDVAVNAGNRLNIADGTYNVTNGAAVNGFWLQGDGALTSSSGTLTVTNGAATGNLSATDHQIKVDIVDFDGGTPLAFVKNNVNNLGLDQPNTYSGGTTINGGRLQALHTSAYGTGAVLVKDTGQAYLVAAGTIANNFTINGLGITEAAGTLGAIRFQNNTVSGNINVASAARITAHGGFGTHTGALTGSADLEINSLAAGNNGTINLNGVTSGYTGTMTLSQGTLNVGALGGGLMLNAGTASISGTIAGTTTINGGTLNVKVGGTVTGNAETLGIATVKVAGTITADAILENGDTLGLAGGTIGRDLIMGATSTTSNANTLNFNSTLAVTRNLVLHGTQTVNMNVIPAPGTPATLITYGGTAGDPDDSNLANNFVLSNPGNWRAAVFTVAGGAVTLNLGAETRTWVGTDATNPTFWDTTSLNWSGSDNKFFNGDSVAFDDSASTYTVALQGLYSPYSITFDNTTHNYDVTGIAGQGFAGSTGIVKNGTGTLALAGFAHSYTGAVQINAGVFKANAYEALGNTSGVTIASGGQLDVNGKNLGNGVRAYNMTIAGAGPDGLGAITNTSATGPASNAGIQNLTLTANASIGGNGGRFDVGLANGFVGGTVNGNGFTLTKVGTGTVDYRGDASGTPINMVIAAGTVTGENYDTCFGGATGTLTVQSGAIVGTYGNLTIATPVTLEANTILQNLNSTAVWTGGITVNGATKIGTSNTTIALTGTISGSSMITKGPGTLYVENANNSGFTGKWLLDENSIYVASDLSFGAVPAVPTADALTLDNVRIGSGTRSGPGNVVIAANRGITMTHLVIFNPGTGGSITVNSPISGAAPPVQYTADISKEAGALTLNGDVNIDGKYIGNAGSTTINGNFTSTEGFDVGTNMVTDINSPTINIGTGGNEGFHAWTGVTNLNIGTGTFADLELGDATSQGHTFNHLAGDLTVRKDFRIGHWGSETSIYNISAGSVSMPDTVTNPTDEAQANLFIGIDGTGFLNISGTAVVNTSSLVVNGRGGGTGGDTLNLTGGRLNIGQWGIRNPAAAVVNLGAGTVGAYADWASSTPMTLLDATTVTVNTLDSVDSTTPRTITLSGVLSGTGGLTKTGAGSLVLTGANTYKGNTTVNADGILVVDGDSIDDAGKLIINGTGKVEITEPVDPVVEIVDTLVINGVPKAAGTYGAQGSGATNIDDDHFSGGGVVQVMSDPSGGYDAWADQITNGQKLRSQDADSDGYTNLQEYLFGTDPMVGNGSLATTTTNGNVLTIRWKELVSGGTYRLMESATLANPWIVSGVTPSDDGAAAGGYQPRMADVTIGAGKDFYRIEGVEN